MKVSIPLKPNEYRFLCVNKSNNNDKVTRVYANDFDAALTQATKRFDPSEWAYESCVFPTHEVWSLNPDGTLRIKDD